MRKKLIYTLLMLLPWIGMEARMTMPVIRLSTGLRGGAAISKVEPVRTTAGGLAMFDLDLTYMWPMDQRLYLGLRSGLSVGYAGYGYRGDFTEEYTNTDFLNHPMNYTNTAVGAEMKVSQLNIEVPLMMAFRYEGFVLGAGFKFLMPGASNSYTQNIQELHINAFYPEYGVTVRDELITGLKEAPLAVKGKNAVSAFNFLWSMDLGYEWQMEGLSYFGVGAFCNLGMVGTKPYEKGTNGRVIDVAPISDRDFPVPGVEVHAMSGLAKITHYMDFGVRMYFAFDIENYNAKGIYSRSHKKGSFGRIPRFGTRATRTVNYGYPIAR